MIDSVTTRRVCVRLCLCLPFEVVGEPPEVELSPGASDFG